MIKMYRVLIILYPLIKLDLAKVTLFSLHKSPPSLCAFEDYTVSYIYPCLNKLGDKEAKRCGV